MTSTDDSMSHVMRMMHFASCVAQIFSNRYIHPDSGMCLRRIAKKNILTERPRNPSHIKGFSRASAAESATSGHSSTTSGDAAAGSLQCAMRYGLAVGPVTTGVLHGKCPSFDAWGGTVNLAGRMEVGGWVGGWAIYVLAFSWAVSVGNLIRSMFDLLFMAGLFAKVQCIEPCADLGWVDSSFL